MNVFAVNLVLAAAWAALVGEFTLPNLTVGFLVAFLALRLMRPLFADDSYFLRVPRLAALALLFLYDLVVSSLRVAQDVLRPLPKNTPGIVAVPLKAATDTEILLVSSLVTLTPGSLSLDLSSDARTLYVHGMFVEDAEDLRREVSEQLETAVLKALR
ncbi:MAG: Na+/H+ antiporter subunit E [Paracoccaceae bacterium]